MDIRPLHPLFVGEVSGVARRQPLSPATVAAIHAGMDQYGILVFHDQQMTPEQQKAMTGQLGTLELGFARVVRNRGVEPPSAPPRTGYAEVADMSNLGEDGMPVERSDRKIVGNMANQLCNRASCLATMSIRMPRSQCFRRCCGRSCELPRARGASCCSLERTRAG